MGDGKMVIVRLNARLQPIHRGEWFEDPLADALAKRGYGEVTGGGTMQIQATGEIEFCDIELQVSSSSTANSIDCSTPRGASSATGRVPQRPRFTCTAARSRR
jgi:hypothetical protein